VSNKRRHWRWGKPAGYAAAGLEIRMPVNLLAIGMEKKNANFASNGKLLVNTYSIRASARSSRNREPVVGCDSGLFQNQFPQRVGGKGDSPARPT